MFEGWEKRGGRYRKGGKCCEVVPSVLEFHAPNSCVGDFLDLFFFFKVKEVKIMW